MIQELKDAAQALGLNMNENYNLEVVKKYIYQGHKIQRGKENQTSEITRKINLT